MSDRALQIWTSRVIERARRDHLRGDALDWRPGDPLRLLFAGYNGARNTGADVRVHEMLRQVRRVLGAEHLRLSVLTQNHALTKGYFDGATQVGLPNVFPPFLGREVPRHHGVIACEGSMFKSRFADALTTMMVGALGIAAARNRLAVGYGAEAGEMSPSLERMVSRYCDSTLILARNEESGRILRRLRVPVQPGTDTAWTFEPHPPEVGRRLLEERGWDGRTPILTICPINPFWWPVKASLTKAAGRWLGGVHRDSHYRSIYFHRSGPEVDRAFERYLSAVAGAVETFRSRHPVFPIVVGMEQLDAEACRRLSELLGDVPTLASSNHDMFELVSVLRLSSMLVSSRYHAIVTTMPTLVPSAGITMDERIHNLMTDRAQEHLLLTVDDPDLEGRLGQVLDSLLNRADAIRPAIGAAVVRNLKLMARMGHSLEAEVTRHFPGFPTRSGVVDWRDYLPPLGDQLGALVTASEHRPAAEHEANRAQGVSRA